MCNREGGFQWDSAGAHESPSEMKPPMVWPSAGHSHELTAALCGEGNTQAKPQDSRNVLALSGGARRYSVGGGVRSVLGESTLKKEVSANSPSGVRPNTPNTPSGQRYPTLRASRGNLGVHACLHFRVNTAQRLRWRSCTCLEYIVAAELKLRNISNGGWVGGWVGGWIEMNG
jgi:hypothetical protein